MSPSIIYQRETYGIDPKGSMGEYNRLRSLFGSFFQPEGAQVLKGKIVGGIVNIEVQEEIESGFLSYLKGLTEGLGLSLEQVETLGNRSVTLNFKKFPVVVNSQTNREYLDSQAFYLRNRFQNSDSSWDYYKGNTPRTEDDVISVVYPVCVPIGRFTEKMHQELDAKLRAAYREGKIEVKPGSAFLEVPIGETLDDLHSYGFELSADLILERRMMTTEGIIAMRQLVGFGDESHDLLSIVQDCLLRERQGSSDLAGNGTLALNPVYLSDSLGFMRSLYEIAAFKELIEMLEVRNGIEGAGRIAKPLLQKKYDQMLESLLERF